uniref:hypothetical protein n=1 Tax=Fusobacterium sp. TaxID=68766 RepID=UPI0025C15276
MAKKKLLFLSAVILLMGTEGYGETFNVGEFSVSKDIVVTDGKNGVIVDEKNNNFINEKEGKISVSGKDSKGIYLKDKGEATNNGTIEATNGGIGVFFGGAGQFTNETTGNVLVSGKGSKGVYLNNKGKAINKGQIIVGQDYRDDKGQTVSGAGAEGVTVNNDKAEFINENLI